MAELGQVWRCACLRLAKQKPAVKNIATRKPSLHLTYGLSWGQDRLVFSDVRRSVEADDDVPERCRMLEPLKCSKGVPTPPLIRCFQRISARYFLRNRNTDTERSPLDFQGMRGLY